jgi:Domain of unknown function (DUF1735)
MKNYHFKKLRSMKRNNINRIFKLGLSALLIAFVGSSCVKSVSGRTDFENLQPTVLLAEGGLANFSTSTITLPPSDDTDTLFFHLNYASTDVAPQDEVIGIAVDDDAIAAYNSANGTSFLKFPDSIYSFTASQNITVPKGANYSAGVPLIVHPDKVDPTISYMLAITIKTAPAGSTISSNYKTIYYHFIGNPLAGPYLWDWTRYNNATFTPPPTGTSFTGQNTTFIPDDPTTVEVYAGYIFSSFGAQGVHYVITFDNNAGVLSNFQVTLNPDDVTYLTSQNIAVTGGPTFITADPVNHIFEISLQVSSAGNPRSLIDKYYR